MVFPFSTPLVDQDPNKHIMRYEELEDQPIQR